MALARVFQESDFGVVHPPWEAAPYGVVSLLAMLEFSARDYVELSNQIGMLLGSSRGQKPNAAFLGGKLGDLTRECNRLSLLITKEHIGIMIKEVMGEDGANVQWQKDGTVTIKGELNQDRICHHIESIYVTLCAELGGMLFRIIPSLKARYCDPQWLVDSPMFSKFPDTVDEFQKAGRCFAYGENTACVFHLMRITDSYLRKVADSLGAIYDARTWQGIGDLINKKMEQRYQSKTDDWKQKEPFYAEILTDLQAISRGHRNPVLHELEKKYDEREAIYMLAVIESFALHVSRNL